MAGIFDGATNILTGIRISNVEVWNRFALSFEYLKIDRIPSFDIRYSVFDIFFLILLWECCKDDASVPINLAVWAAMGEADT